MSVLSKQWSQTITSCTKSCPVNQYIFQQACLKECPQFTTQIDNGFIKYCINPFVNELECPSIFCNPEYSYCLNGNCVSSCPEYTVNHNGSCLMKCPKDLPYITAYCDGVCYTGAKFCSKTCPYSHPYIFRSLKLLHCLVECPKYTTIDGKFCKLSCPVDSPLLFNNTCFKKCPDTHPMIVIQTSPFNQIFTCRTECPKDNASFRNVCVFVCPNGTFFDNGLQRQCVDRCGNKRPFITTTPSERNSIYYKQCVSSCPLRKYVLNRNATLECVDSCPSSMFSLYNNSCVLKCPLSYPMKMITTVNRIEITICVKSCPNDMFIHGKVCVYRCPTPLVHYMSKCVSECRKSLPIILKINRTCIAACPVRSVRYNNTCIDECPKHAPFIENGTCSAHCADANSLSVNSSVGKTCINSETCTNETMLMNGTNTCIIDCPRKTHVIIKDVCTNISECLEPHVLQDTKRGYQCQENCSSDLYRNGMICVSQCPGDKLIMDRNCTDTCYGTRPFKYGGTECVSECPDEYFKHQNECLTASSCWTYGLYYTFNKTCYVHCPPNTSRHPKDQICIPFDPSKILSEVIAFLFFAICLFIVFYMMCCFKGFNCTGLKSCVSRTMQ